MVRFVLLLYAATIITGCDEIESEVRSTSTPRSVSAECKQILVAGSTISKFGSLYRSVYKAVEKGTNLSSIPDSHYLNRSSAWAVTEIDKSLERLREFDDSNVRWASIYSTTGRAGSFFSLTPDRDQKLTGDDRYLTLKQLRTPIGAMQSIENYAVTISREHGCNRIG